jgi:osmotically inducible protein OsmC
LKSTASAVWKGNLREGIGVFRTQSGAVQNVLYSFATRFEGQSGSNPEELIAAAHAGCFSMALSGELSKLNLIPVSIQTTATITLEMLEKGPTITSSHLETRGKVPGASAEVFRQAAKAAEANCPISRLLNTKITLDATLLGES